MSTQQMKHAINTSSVKAFLNVSEYSEMTFSASSSSIDNEGARQFDGMLTLLGNTQPLALDVQLDNAKTYFSGHKGFTFGKLASAASNRSGYGVDYGVASALVGNTVSLIIETEVIQDD